MNTLIVRATMAALRDRKGVSALEYGILAAAILTAVATATTSLGNEIGTFFAAVIAKIVALTPA